MAAQLTLEIVTPQGPVYKQDVEMVTLPGREGEMGILPMHVPLITLLGDGEIIAKRGAVEDRLLVTGGCVEITPERVAVLTVFATDEQKIDETKAEDARKRAEARLQEKDKLSPEELVMVQASLSHSLAQLNLKRRRRQP